MQVTSQSYRAHLIVWWAEKIPGTNFWKGRAAISGELRQPQPNRIEGPDDRFETENEARNCIFQAAKEWIDNTFN